MQSDSKKPFHAERTKAVLFFFLHQAIGTLGVAIVAATLAFFSFGTLRPMNPHLFTARNASWLLTETPYYPLQILVGLWSGWLLSRRWPHRSMLWVWVLPLAFLCYTFVAIPTLVPEAVAEAFQAGVGQSRISHYFGWGCSIRNRCVDQLVVTMPFYASVSYSIVALVARKMPGRLRSVVDEQTSESFVQGS
jgi:hypothetical protein